MRFAANGWIVGTTARIVIFGKKNIIKYNEMKRKVIDKASFIEYLARLPGKYYTETMFNVYFRGNFKEVDILDKQEEKIVKVKNGETIEIINKNTSEENNE